MDDVAARTAAAEAHVEPGEAWVDEGTFGEMPALAADGPAGSLTFAPAAFGDVDLFSEWEIGLGWDIESTQLSAGAAEVEFDHFAFPELLVGNFRSNRKMLNLFSVPEGVVILVFSRAKLPIMWCGVEIAPDVLGIVRSTQPHWVVIPDGLDAIEFMISEDLIRRTELFPPEFYRRTGRFERAYLPLTEPETGQFIQRMSYHFWKARTAQGPLEAAVGKAAFYEDIIQGLQRVIDAGLVADDQLPPRTTRRFDLVVQARELLAGHMDEDLTSDEIAQALGVSYRSLNYAFKDALSVSPYRFFQTERLHAARRTLKMRDVSVTEAAFAHGFYTPSRFTRQYARLFGELPSETAGRTRRW